MKKIYKKFKEESGVTMAELLISMSLFAIFIAIAVGGFTQAIRNQRIALKLMSATDNMAFPLEQMMREMRVGGDFLSENSYPNALQSISFKKSEGSVVSPSVVYKIEYYYDSNQKAIFRKKTRLDDFGNETTDVTEDRLTAEGVIVKNFRVMTFKPESNGPTRITLSITVAAVDRGKEIENTIQTTVSARAF